MAAPPLALRRSQSATVSTLVNWGDRTRRPLPWRDTRDPWAVLVSELMLQQTQATRVEERWPVFLDRFPDPATCAAASVGDVVRAWVGLGYNRRAVNLHRTAVGVVERFGGRLPDDLGALLTLPGIGPYTARAVLAFAFERDVGVLDVNANRALSRVVGHPITQPEADRLVPPGWGWAWNQAVLDLGATVCRADPACVRCPMADDCAWFRDGRPEPDPWARARPQSPLEGSDRQGRGRLVDALRLGPVAAADLPEAMGWPDDRARADRVANRLIADGLAVIDTETWRLP